jgi:hypothetical protein
MQRRASMSCSVDATRWTSMALGRPSPHLRPLEGVVRDALHDDPLLLGGGVAHAHVHHEAVHLRLGERIGALLLHRVLRGHDHERLGQLVGGVPDGDLLLLHGLEQRALHLGGRAVDLVGQHQVREDGALLGAELAALLVVEHGAHHVGRQQVGRELDARELGRDVLQMVLTVSVLARPGTPSSSTWPPVSKPMSTRWTISGSPPRVGCAHA